MDAPRRVSPNELHRENAKNAKGQQQRELVLCLGHRDTPFFLQMQYPQVRRGLRNHPKRITKPTVLAMIRASADLMDLSNSEEDGVPAYPSIGITAFRFFLPPNPPSVG